jgi:hypothetical protein
VAFFFSGVLAPKRRTITVADATKANWHPKTFWFEPRGRSGVHKVIDVFAPKDREVRAPVASSLWERRREPSATAGTPEESLHTGTPASSRWYPILGASPMKWASYVNTQCESQAFAALRDRATYDESDARCAATLDGY